MKDKNLAEINGSPCLSYPARAAKKVGLIDGYFISSDDEAILKAGESYGYQKIVRPESLARADSQHHDVIVHALDFMQAHDVHPEFLVVLLANAPIVLPEWIEACIRLLMENTGVSSVVPVVEGQDCHPYRAKKIDSDGFLRPCVALPDSQVSSNRNDLFPVYFPAHNFYVLRRENFSPECMGDYPWRFMGRNTLPYFLEYSIDIHGESDLLPAAQWLRDFWTEELNRQA